MNFCLSSFFFFVSFFLVVVRLLVGKHTFFIFFLVECMMTLCEIFHSTFSSLDGHLQAESYEKFVLIFFFVNLSHLGRFLSAFRVVVYAHVVNFLPNFYP